jgi:hypothetical protein
VAEVYPELVVRDATTGRIDGGRYDELAPMLLNEVQLQRAELRNLKHQLTEVNETLAKLLQKDQAIARR